MAVSPKDDFDMALCLRFLPERCQLWFPSVGITGQRTAGEPWFPSVGITGQRTAGEPRFDMRAKWQDGSDLAELQIINGAEPPMPS